MARPRNNLPVWLACASSPPVNQVNTSVCTSRQWWPAQALTTPDTHKQQQEVSLQTTPEKLLDTADSLEELTALCMQSTSQICSQRQPATTPAGAEEMQQHPEASTAWNVDVQSPQDATGSVAVTRPMNSSATEVTTGLPLPLLLARQSFAPGARAGAASKPPARPPEPHTAATWSQPATDKDNDDIPLLSDHKNPFLDASWSRAATDTVARNRSSLQDFLRHGTPVPSMPLSGSPTGSNVSMLLSMPTVDVPTVPASADPQRVLPHHDNPYACNAQITRAPGLCDVEPSADAAGIAASKAAGLSPVADERAAPPVCVLYVGVFLTPESREVLLSMVPPLHPLLKADHMTLAYKPAVGDLQQFPLGREVVLRVLGSASNSRVQAVFVEGPPWLETSSASAHITISVAAGARAVEAGHVIRDALQQAAADVAADFVRATSACGGYQHLGEPLELVGRLGVKLAVSAAATSSAGCLGASDALAGRRGSNDVEVVVFSQEDLAGCGCLPPGDAGSVGGSPSRHIVEATSEQEVSLAETPRSSSTTSSNSIDAVQFLSSVHVGDYVAVRPFVMTGNKAALLQGYVQEIACEEPFQADGVLVVLSDNTIGYVSQVLDSISGKQGVGTSTPAAACIKHATAMPNSSSRPGSSSSSTCKRSSGSASAGPVSLTTVQAALAGTEGTAVPGLDGSNSGNSSTSSSDNIRQWMQEAGCDVAPVAGADFPHTREEKGQGEADRDVQLWREFDVLQQQHGEALCASILASCDQDLAEAIGLIRAQQQDWGLLTADAAAAAADPLTAAAECLHDAPASFTPSAVPGSSSGLSALPPPPPPPATVQMSAPSPRPSPPSAAILPTPSPISWPPSTAAAAASCADASTAAAPSATSCPDTCLLQQLALGCNILPDAALQLALLAPSASPEAVIQQLLRHEGNINMAADALLSGDAQAAASAAAGTSRGLAGGGLPLNPEAHAAKAFLAGGGGSVDVGVRRLQEMSPGLTGELCELLLREHGGDMHQAARALSDMQACELQARSAAAGTPSKSAALLSYTAAQEAGSRSSSRAQLPETAAVELSEADQLAILCAMGELEPEQHHHQEQQQQQHSPQQPTYMASPQLPSSNAFKPTAPSWCPAVSPAPPPPPPRASQPSMLLRSPLYPPQPPAARHASPLDVNDFEAKRAAREAADKLYAKGDSLHKTHTVLLMAAQSALKAGNTHSYRELLAQAQQAKADSKAAVEEAQRIAWSANNARSNCWEVDLHGLSVAKATAKFEQQFRALQALDHPGGVLFRIIVGKGLHSEGNVPKIKLGILQYLEMQAEAHIQQQGTPWGITWEVDGANPGLINVHIPASDELAA